jgi:hypothetical protein
VRSRSSINRRLPPIRFSAIISVWNGVSFDGRVEGTGLQFAKGLHLERLVHGEQQVGHFRLRFQHRAEDVIEFVAAHRLGRDARVSPW